MGDFPPIAPPLRQTVTIAVPPDWKDHHFQGRPVLPAVAAMILLAGWSRAKVPDLQIQTMSQLRFSKFLEIDPAADSIKAQYDVTPLDAAQWRAALMTRTTSRSGTISRYIEHAAMVFGRRPEPAGLWPLDLAASLTGVCFSVESKVIYNELVPFGPAFRSICSPLALSEDGAMAMVRAPELAGHADDPLLGSPFPLDGAFHAACVWSQRYAGVVAFPVAIEKRTVFDPTRPGETYTARILPVQVNGPSLRFDIQIMDPNGRVREAATSVEMRDVSRGRWLPPQWIGLDAAPLPTADWWPDSCAGLVLMERARVAEYAHLALSPTETSRLAGMGAKRRIDYLSARLACKQLWRRLSSDTQTPAPAIDTIIADQPHPVLPPVPGHPAYCCSVSHDERFSVAVAATAPIGVDVEKITPRAFNNRRIFMHPAEQDLVPPDGVDAPEAALRIWSIKEAAAKALGLTLADAWQQVEVLALDKTSSRFRLPNGKTGWARHADIQGHLFTIVGGAEPAKDWV